MAQNKWGKIQFRGQTAYVLSNRVTKDESLKIKGAGLFKYEIRHAEESEENPVEIALGISTNFFGVIITKTPIQLKTKPIIIYSEGKEPENTGRIRSFIYLSEGEREDIRSGALGLDDCITLTLDEIIKKRKLESLLDSAFVNPMKI